MILFFKRKLVLIITILFLSFVTYAQVCPPGGCGGGDPGGNVPITGVEILIGIGSLFGASRFLKSKNKSKESW